MIKIRQDGAINEKNRFLYTFTLRLTDDGMHRQFSSSDAGDYINPGFTAKTVNTNLAYTGISSGCTAGNGCQAILYTGEVNNTEYVGIAVKNSSYNLKIYWPGSSIEFNSTSIPGCTVKEGTTTISNTVITMSIHQNADPYATTYTITFSSTIAGTDISSGDTIVAQLY